MAEHVNRPAIIAVTIVILLSAVVVPLMFLGGQTSTILSTVGSAIGPNPGGGAATAPEPGSGTGTGGAATGAASGTGSAEIADAAATIPTLLIVRTGELRLEVGGLDAAIARGDAAVLAAGGYVSASTRAVADEPAAASAVVTYRIPSARWDATLDALHRLAARVDSETITTDEVTGQVVDLGARIANLRASEAALQAIMAKAVKITDVLDVQRQLTTTRGEIEGLVGKKQQLEDQAAFGSLVGHVPPAGRGPTGRDARPAEGLGSGLGRGEGDRAARPDRPGRRRPPGSGWRSSGCRC